MVLTKEQQAILDGEKGETLAKVMKTLVMYGDAFEAEKLVPITSKYNHLVTSFGLKVMSPVYDLMQQLLDAGVCSEQKFSVDPRPLDKNVPASFLQNLVFNKFMYTKQSFYEEQLEKLGLMDQNAFTCTCRARSPPSWKCRTTSSRPRASALQTQAICVISSRPTRFPYISKPHFPRSRTAA